ncbi:MAG: hypothetical protein HFI19_13610 [Lachnospiraceae bacterium]|nr:hypothetical protein [Lachnospiraceae bacterium]
MQGINSISMSGIQTGQMRISPMGDAVTRGLQSQIEEVQRQIQNVIADESLTMEEKLKKKQELQDKIMELQDQLQQHLAEQRQEQREERTKAAEQKSYDETGMQTVISSDAAVKNARVQESTAARMEGRVSVLKSEMELDTGRNMGTIKSKTDELARAEQGAENARSTQMQILGKTNQDLADAAKAKSDPEKAKEEKTEKSSKEQGEEAKPIGYTSDGKPVKEEEESQMTAWA